MSGILIAKRLLEDQNLKRRTSSWGLLVRKSSLLSKFVFTRGQLFFLGLQANRGLAQ